MSILDVGCGTGTHLEMYQRYRCNLFGIDSSPAMLDIAREKLGDKAALYLGDATEMHYDDNSFDLVILMLVLHEMKPQTRTHVIKEMKRVLKDDGHILLIDFHPGPIQAFEGWRTKAIIFLSEIAAGREHFRNYRHFMSIRGLPAIIEENGLVVKKQKIVGGGALALFLLQKEGC
jgi:ubiquinone/menaquinone biosynthesis C-methylase UbiE